MVTEEQPRRASTTLDVPPASAGSPTKPPGRGRARRPTRENMLDKDNLLSGCDEFGTRIRIFTATLTGEREYKAHLGKFSYTGTTIPADGELPSDVTQTEEVVEATGEKGRLESGRVRHGYGEIKYQSGSVFMGQWEHNKRTGKGKFVYPCGDVYDGEWKAGHYHGHGKYTSGDSDGRALEYEGEWKGDKMDGNGRYIYKDTGDVFEGHFVNGFREGFGKYTTKSGEVYMGEYDGGELRSKTKIDKDNISLGTDEWGKRIQFFTASLTGEQALSAGLGKFVYTGETIASSDQASITGGHVEKVKDAPGEDGRLASGLVRDGYGEIKYDSGGSYTGHWEHDKRVGTGKFVFACGDIYEGEWMAGMYHGHGKYTSADSDEYEGQWESDKMEGHGRYHYRNTGDIYEGEWTGGLSHGFGTDEWGKRIKFFTATLTGEQAIKAGLGKFVYTGDTVAASGGDGSKQVERVIGAPGGRLQGTSRGHLTGGGVRHGEGEIKYDSGSIYSGQWEDDRRSGKGKYIFACGDVYDGEWKGGTYHGHGKYTSADSDEYEGQWKYDKMDGHGTYHYRDTGDVYVGSFVNSVCEGHGKYTTAKTGETVEGTFVAGKLRERPTAPVARAPVIKEAQEAIRNTAPLSTTCWEQGAAAASPTTPSPSAGASFGQRLATVSAAVLLVAIVLVSYQK